MQTLTFKTNIKCSGCVARVTPHLDAVKDTAGNWQVDIQNPNKILTVKTDTVSSHPFKEAVQNAGFAVEQF